MSQPYYCKECGRLDEEGISGHDMNRCRPPAPVNLTVVNDVNDAPYTATDVERDKALFINAVVNETKKKRSKDRHKKRLEYQKIKQREYRARQKALKGSK